jgi:signal transduction histidine kinase/ActR/RegA family two-component response regulator
VKNKWFAPLASLRVSAFLLVMLAILPALVLSLANGLELRRASAARAGEDALLLARQASNNRSELTERTRQLLVALGQVPALREGDPASGSAFLADVLKVYPAYANLGTASPGGDVVCSAIPATTTVSIADRAWFQRAMETREFVVGEYSTGPISGKAVILLAYPALDASGEVQRVLFASLDLVWLSRFSLLAQLPAGYSLTMLDSSGNVLAHYPDPELWVGKAVPESSLAQAIPGHSEAGFADTVGLDGVHRLYGIAPLTGPGVASPGYVLVGVPASVAYAAADWALRRNLAALVLSAVLALLVALFGGRWVIVAPVNALLATTKRLASGDLGARSPIAAPQGEMGRLGLAFNDMAESLQRQQELTRIILDNLTESVVVFDGEGRLAFLNPTALEWYAISALTVPAEQWAARNNLYQPDARTPLRPEDTPPARALRGEHVRGLEVAIVPVGKPPRYVLASADPLLDTAGRKIGAIVAMYDITERKHMEAQIRRTQRMESIGTLASGIAHDLNNVLTPIMMACSLLRPATRDPENSKLVDAVETNVERGAALVRQILAFARGVEGEHIAVQVRSLLQEMDKVAKETFPRAIQVRVQAPGELWGVQGDPTQLMQVLLNLCVNARDAMPEGGTLSLTGRNLMADPGFCSLHLEAQEGPYVVIGVSDTGTGIAPEHVQFLFEPFFTTKEQGSGLGLSIVYGIVKSHGGFVTVHSEPGGGSRFDVYLPAVGEASAAEQPAPQAALSVGHGELILVVDDELSIREMARAVFETYGYRVLCAADGREAMALCGLHRGEIALALVDSMMPVMSGAATLRALRQMSVQFKIICASGFNPVVTQTQLADLGVNAFLAKPYTARLLLETVHQLLSESPSGPLAAASQGGAGA